MLNTVISLAIAALSNKLLVWNLKKMLNIVLFSRWAGWSPLDLPRRQSHEPRQAPRQYRADPRRRESTLQGTQISASIELHFFCGKERGIKQVKRLRKRIYFCQLFNLHSYSSLTDVWRTWGQKIKKYV